MFAIERRMQNAECKMQNAECRMQNAEPTTTDARSKGRSKVYFDYALQEGRKWNIKPRAEGKLACTMPRCEGGKAYEVGLMQNGKIILNFEF